MVYDGVEYNGKNNIPLYESRCDAELPTLDDIKVLLGNVTSIGHLPTNGTAPSAQKPMRFYDAFVGGPGAAGAVGRNYALNKTLVGYADNMDSNPQRFFGMGKYTKFWTAEECGTGCAYPLSLERESNSGTISNYIAYINAGHAKRYGMVVRYVFRPSVQTSN